MTGIIVLFFLAQVARTTSGDSVMVMEKLERIEQLLLDMDMRVRRIELVQTGDKKLTANLNTIDEIVLNHLNKKHPEFLQTELYRHLKQHEADYKMSEKKIDTNRPGSVSPREAKIAPFPAVRVRRHIVKKDTPIHSNETLYDKLSKSITKLLNATSKPDSVKKVLEEIKDGNDHIRKETHSLYHMVEDLTELIKKNSKVQNNTKVLAELKTIKTSTKKTESDVAKLKSSLTSCMTNVTKKENFSSCVDVKKKHKTNGEYTINIGKSKVQVYCDQETDGGGWIVFQRRIDGSIDFNKDWQDYKKGFGEKKKEFWLGNEWISALTKKGPCELRVDLVKLRGRRKVYAKYKSFRILSEDESYRLEIGTYSGNAGDDLTYHDDMKFSTLDRDNDENMYSSCSRIWKGGWWFNDCFRVHLNAVISRRFDVLSNQDQIRWGRHILRRAEMKLKCT